MGKDLNLHVGHWPRQAESVSSPVRWAQGAAQGALLSPAPFSPEKLHGDTGVSFSSALLPAWECRRQSCPSLKSVGTHSWPCTRPGHGGLGKPEPPPPVPATGCWVHPAPLLLPGDLGKSKERGALRHHQQVPGSNGVSAAIRYLITLLNK